MKLCIFPVYELREGTRRVHLTPQEGLLTTALLSYPEVTAERFIETLWPDAYLGPEWEYEDLIVLLTRLRRKLNQIGWTVSCRRGASGEHRRSAKMATLQGYGWHLEESFREMRLAA